MTAGLLFSGCLLGVPLHGIRGSIEQHAEHVKVVVVLCDIAFSYEEIHSSGI